jgi:tetratricopeptide (TPR) repeat protein
MVMIFDDLDRAPALLKPVFSMLSELIRGTGSTLLVASSERPDFYSLKHISLENRVMEIVMEPLDDRQSQKLLGPDSKISKKNYKIAGGHPLTLKLLAAGMAPEGLAGFVEDEILSKNSELADICRFASILRKPFSPDEFVAFGMNSAKDVRGSLLFEARNEGYALHPAISSIMLATASDRMLGDLHRKAAEFYRRETADVSEILHHLVEAGDFSAAKKLALENGEGMLSKGNPEDVARSLEFILKRDEDADFELMDIAAKAMDQAGNWPSAARLAKKIENEAAGTYWAMSAKLLRANILAKTGKTKDALILLGDVLESAKDPGNALMAEAHYSAASVLRKLGRNPAALEEAEMAIKLSGKIGDELLNARSLMESAMIISSGGRQDEALERLEKASAYFEGLGNVSDVIRCGINRGMILRAINKKDEAVEILERSVKLAQESGLSRFKAHGLANLTDILNSMGEYQRSSELAKEAVEIFSGLGEPMMQAASMLNLGSALAGRGKKDEAIIAIDGAISILEEKGLLEARRHWLVECADILRGIGEKDRAAAVLAKAGKKKSQPLNIPSQSTGDD